MSLNLCFLHLCPEMNAIARITNHKSKEQNNENSISSRKLQISPKVTNLCRERKKYIYNENNRLSQK